MFIFSTIWIWFLVSTWLAQIYTYRYNYFLLGTGFGPGIPGLQLGVGIGAGCGVGLGFGYGFGRGIAFDHNRRYSNVPKFSVSALPSQYVSLSSSQYLFYAILCLPVLGRLKKFLISDFDLEYVFYKEFAKHMLVGLRIRDSYYFMISVPLP